MFKVMVHQPASSRMVLAIGGAVMLLVTLYVFCEFERTRLVTPRILASHYSSRGEAAFEPIAKSHAVKYTTKGSLDKHAYVDSTRTAPTPGSSAKDPVLAHEPPSTVATGVFPKYQEKEEARQNPSAPSSFSDLKQSSLLNTGIPVPALPPIAVRQDIYDLDSSIQGDSIVKDENPAQYYGAKMMQKYSLSRMAFNSPILTLTPKTEGIFSTNASRIASWDPEGPTHRAPGAHVVFSFLKYDNGQYRATLYVANVFSDKTFRRPPLNISIKYKDAADAELACDYIPPVETSHLKYTGIRDFQAHICHVPPKFSNLLKFKEIDNLKASLYAVDHNYTVHVDLREWDTEQGHAGPTDQYEFTSVTFLKPQYRRCAQDRCDPPVIDRVAEWVAHHLLIGFDHMYLYASDGWDLLQQRLAPFIQMGKVTVIAANELDNPPVGGAYVGQVLSFSSHLERYRNCTKYIFIQDIDEMLYISPTSLLPGPEGGFPDHLDSLLSKFVYKQNRVAERTGKPICAISFRWFTLSPDSTDITDKSIIKSYHRSMRAAPPDTYGEGSYKTLTKSSCSSPYSTEHFTTLDPQCSCHRVFANVSESFLIHYRASARDSLIQPADFTFQQHFTDGLFAGVSKLMVDLKLW